MFDLLWLIPAVPFASAAILAVLGARLPRKAVSLLACGSIAISAIVTGLIAWSFITAPPPNEAYNQHLWTWLAVDNFRPDVGLYLDALSLVMLLVVTFVSFLIHVYSTEFMAGDEGYSRF